MYLSKYIALLHKQIKLSFISRALRHKNTAFIITCTQWDCL